MSKNIQVPQGWEVKKLEEVGLFLKGKGIKKDELVTQGLPCIIYGQIYTTYDYYTHNLISFIPEYLKHSTTEIFKNDILFAGSGETKEEIGKSITYLGNTPAYAGGDIIILRQNVLISKYITFYLNSIGRKQLNKLGQGDSVVHIYKSSLEIINIPVPPLEEQKKIAEILSLWDKAIEQTKDLIAYKEKQKKGLMQALLTGKKRLQGFTDEWKTYQLGEIAYTYGGLTNKTKNDFGSNGNKYISYLDIYQNYYLNEPTNNYVSIAENEIQTGLKHGDILFTLSSETPEEVGISCVILFEPNEKIYLNSFSFCLRLKENNILHPLFSAFIFRAEHLRQSINKLAQGATRYNLSKANFLKLNITIPTSLDEQKAIADILSSADKEIELLNKQLELYTEQKKGLMQNLLTGKVRV